LLRQQQAQHARMKLKILLILMATALVSGFGWGKKEKKPAEKPVTNESLPAGYALLFKLLSDEKDVSKLLLIKKDRRELHQLIKEIADSASTAHKQLERNAKHLGLALADQKLPTVELAARESISKEKAKELLSTKGDEFEFRLLMSQHEALTYGIHLARQLAEAETDRSQRELLQEVRSQFGQLRGRVFEMLFRPTNH